MSDPFDPVNMAMRNLHNQNLLAAKDARIRQLEERLETLLDAIERTGGLDNIRRVEVSQPVVIDMARENAFMKGENERLRKAGDAVCESPYLLESDPAVIAWRAAKEGKQP
jgi:hypothetical protein